MFCILNGIYWSKRFEVLKKSIKFEVFSINKIRSMYPHILSTLLIKAYRQKLLLKYSEKLILFSWNSISSVCIGSNSSRRSIKAKAMICWLTYGMGCCDRRLDLNTGWWWNGSASYENDDIVRIYHYHIDSLVCVWLSLESEPKSLIYATPMRYHN